MTFTLTDEQRGIIAATPSYERPLMVKAFAGTGKTFTLRRYAEARPQSTMLYAAFNKAIQMEAQRKMPSNVTARTTHSLAYQAIGCEYNRAGKLYPNLPVFKVAQHLGIQDVVTASFAISVVKSYLASDDVKISEKHVDIEIRSYFETRPRLIDTIVAMAKEVWDSMQKLHPSSLAMTHDGYLKLYQLTGPVLDFEYILLDEAQDTTQCVWDIMIKQDCRKIIVGDPHQAIYGWRGAVDAMELVGKSDVHYLSKSFRFGPELAALASTLLQRHMGETKELRGNDEMDTRVILGSAPANNHTLITRTNNTVFKTVAFECYNTNTTLGFVGGGSQNYRFQLYLDIWNVYRGNRDRVRDPVIKSFGEYMDIVEYAVRTKNQELKGACAIVDQYRHKVPEVLRRTREREVGAQLSDLSFVTGHKSKGLEFPVVELGGDFETLKNDFGDKGLPRDELNLLYVALTRATSKLYFQRSFHDWIVDDTADSTSHQHHHFSRPTAPPQKKSLLASILTTIQNATR